MPQNEELRRTQIELEAACDRYAVLYDFSPAGHLTLDTSGTIVEANLRAATVLGVNRKELIGQSFGHFVARDDQDTLHRHCQEVFKTGTRQSCEVRLTEKPGVSCCVHLESIAMHEEPGRSAHWRTALLDITERKRAEQEQTRLIEDLTRSQQHFQSLFNWTPSAVGISTVAEGRFIDVNEGFSRLTGYTREEVIGRTTLELGLWADPSERAIVLQELQKQGSLHNREGRLRTKSGEIRSLMISLHPIQLGSTPCLIYLGHDITERKWAETALQASDAFTRAVLNSLSAHVCVLDKEGVIVTTNDAWKEFGCLNLSRGVPIIDVGQNYLDVCRRASTAGDTTAQAILGGIEVVLGGSQPSFSTEYACHSPEEERWFLMRVTPLKDAKGVVISHTDISRRVRMGFALEQHALLLSEKQNELESLAGKLIEAQEAERKRIARELHDDFNQRLAALSIELEGMERTPIALPELIMRQLAAVRVQVGTLSDDLHDLAYRLHPSLLGHVGLEVAARDHVAEFAKRTGLSVRFLAREVPKTISSEVATNLFRVLQESLQNVAKHAQANDVTVRLSGSSKGVGLSVRDNGKGFDLEDKNAGAKGLGVVSMQERARGLGGLLRIHSLPRNGTKVCVWIPHFQEDA